MYQRDMKSALVRNTPLVSLMNPILCLEISLIDMCANMCMLWRSAKAWAGVCLGWTLSCCGVFSLMLIVKEVQQMIHTHKSLLPVATKENIRQRSQP